MPVTSAENGGTERADFQVPNIWELECKNGNGILMKQLTGDLGLQIMNCVWKGMSGATGSMDAREFTLDYLCVDRKRIACVVEAVIMD